MRDTRQSLLLEAETLIRRRGYAGFSYADLAEAVGLRKASIHHHFATKSEMAIALLAAYDARYDEALAAILREERGALSRIGRYADLYLDGVEKGLGCLCAAFATEFETLPDRLRRDLGVFFGKHVAWLERVLIDGRENDGIRSDVSAAALARMILASLEGSLMMERAMDGCMGFKIGQAALVQVLRSPTTV